MFSGNFGIRSIVIYKCSGKYIDIYFSLKITYLQKFFRYFFFKLKKLNIKKIINYKSLTTDL